MKLVNKRNEKLSILREVSHIQEIGDAGEVQGDAGDTKSSINTRL